MLFQQRVNDVLKNCPYSQKQIAKILNISEGNITNWKNGDNMPSIEILYRLCILLNVSSDYLLGLENDDGSKAAEYEFEYQHNGTTLKHKEKKG